MVAGESSRSRWSWRFVAGLALIAALAQACGGSSSQSSGPQGGRLELRFSQVKSTRLGALPQGCSKVDVTFQPGNRVFTINDTQGSILLTTGQYVASAVVLCNGVPFASDKPDPVVNVPAGLGTVQVAFVFGGVNVLLTVQVGPGVSVTGDGISCPGDCTQTFFAGSTVKLTANNPAAVFTGGCNGTGSCNALMNQDKTVFVNLPAVSGSLRVTNIADPEFCCPTGPITFTGPGPIPSIADLDPGQSATRTNLTPGNYVANWCGGLDPFSIQAGQQTTLNLDGAECG